MTMPKSEQEVLNLLAGHTRWQEPAAGAAGSSHFIGTNAADNKAFTGGIGDWVQGSGNAYTLSSDADGQAGNGGKCLIGSSPSTTLMSLSGATILTAFTVGERYQLTQHAQYNSAWNGGIVTCTIDGQVNVLATLTTDYVLDTFKFTAAGTAASLAYTCATGPTQSDEFYIDTLELVQISVTATKAAVSGTQHFITWAHFWCDQDSLLQIREGTTVKWEHNLDIDVEGKGKTIIFPPGSPLFGASGSAVSAHIQDLSADAHVSFGGYSIP